MSCAEKLRIAGRARSGKRLRRMAALRKQARQLGDNTAASADMQLVRRLLLRKPVGMLMPFSGNAGHAEYGAGEPSHDGRKPALLMGMKSAFQLSNDKVAHSGMFSP